MKPQDDQPIEPRRTLRLSAILVELREAAVPEKESRAGELRESRRAGIAPGSTFLL
jgi:hypothetical protein